MQDGSAMNRKSGVRQYFETSFGGRIGLDEDHLAFERDTAGVQESPAGDWSNASINTAGGHDKVDYDRVAESLREEKVSITVRGYGARFWRVYMLLRMLQDSSLSWPFRKGLDVGTGYGIQPRIMRGIGLVQEAVGIDIYDRATAVDERDLLRKHRQFRRHRYADWLRELCLRVPEHRRSGWQHALVSQPAATPRYSLKHGVGWLADSGIYRIPLSHPPRLDRYLNQDIFVLEEKFDLITSYASLEWFEANSILAKISSLLEDGGVFYLWVPNWWCAKNPTRLTGHFPFASQRLTQDDYFRYLDEFMPEAAEASKTAYRYLDPGHPTLSDYLRIGVDNGLVPLGFHPLIKPDDFYRRSGINSLGYLRRDFSSVMEVLEDIRRFRPDITVQDLLPHSHAILFQKIATDGRASPETYKRWRNDLDHARLSAPGWIKKLGKLVGKWNLK